MTEKVISRSNVRLAGEPSLPNLRIDPLTASDVVKSRHLPSNHPEDNEEHYAAIEQASHDASTSSHNKSMPILNPNDLVGRIFLLLQEDGQQLRARIVKALCYYE